MKVRSQKKGIYLNQSSSHLLAWCSPATQGMQADQRICQVQEFWRSNLSVLTHHLMVVSMARNSNTFIWALCDFQAQPATGLHFHNFAGIEALSRWCLTASSLLACNSKPSPFTEMIPSIFLINSREDFCLTIPARCSGGLRSKVCKFWLCPGVSILMICETETGEQRPRGAQSCPSNHTIIPTCQEFPRRVSREFLPSIHSWEHKEPYSPLGNPSELPALERLVGDSHRVDS